MSFLGLITRCKDEFFIEEFCEYYLSQGVDKIFVIDDDSINKLIYKNITSNKVDIIYEKNIIETNYANEFYKKIKSNFTWMIYCDVDEFITTKKNISKTIREELNTTFRNIDCIKIPWVMMSCNKVKNNPKSILMENIYRWNHNIKHPNEIKKFRCRYNEIEVKCIFKTKLFNGIIDHRPILNGKKNPIVKDSIEMKKKNLLDNFFYNFRETHINNGILLCYHYRIVSIENSLNKLNTNFWYIKNKYTINDLINTDYSEIKDETLKYKSYCNFIKNQLLSIKSKSYLGLITRCKDEYYIEEFCNYYLNEGVDNIFILDDKSENLNIYNNLISNQKIKIIYVKNNSKCHDKKCSKFCTCNRVLANEIYKCIKNKFEWIIYVDVDEFITTKKNDAKTIRNELETTYKNVDCISIPWIIMSPLNKLNPKSVIKTNIYRLNYDDKPNFICKSKKGSAKFGNQASGIQIQTKSIFKCKYFDGIHDTNNPSDHHPVFPNKNNIKWIESVKNSKVKINFKNYCNSFTENDIKNSYFLCYHYRIVSEEHAIKKLKTNDWYIENEYSLDDLMNSSKDIKDETIKNKTEEMLKFVHITKTSGSYIEKLGYEKNILWGLYDDKLSYLKNKYNRKGQAHGCPWHEPLAFLNEKPYNNFTKLFTIIRNPYDRIISECLCKWGSIYCKKMETVNDFNNYIAEQVNKATNLSFHHFTPQYFYTHNIKGEKVVDYIIKYEEIDKFNELMKKYNIDICYTYKHSISKKKFSISDITRKNINLINKIYNLDFIYFNYEKK